MSNGVNEDVVFMKKLRCVLISVIAVALFVTACGGLDAQEELSQSLGYTDNTALAEYTENDYSEVQNADSVADRAQHFLDDEDVEDYNNQHEQCYDEYDEYDVECIDDLDETDEQKSPQEYLEQQRQEANDSSQQSEEPDTDHIDNENADETQAALPLPIGPSITVVAGGNTHTITLIEMQAASPRAFSAYPRDEQRNFRGVPFATLFRHFNIDYSQSTSIMIFSYDGFGTAISMAEALDIQQAFIAFSEDGVPFYGKGGNWSRAPFMLVMAQDPFPNRFARYITEIVLQ